MKQEIYEGWELKFFDNAKNFRSYQFSLIKNYLNGSVGEIGPGNGAFYDLYKNCVNSVHLYEPSKNFIHNLHKKKNHQTEIFNSYFIEKPKFYDAIIYMDVLEHIESDKNEVEKAFNSLKKGGKLIINVPAFSFLYSQFDKDIGHYRRYSKKSLNNLLTTFPFKEIKMKYYDSIGFLLSFLSKKINKDYRKNFGTKIKIWDSLIPIAKFLDLLLINRFGKSLIVICTK